MRLIALQDETRMTSAWKAIYDDLLPFLRRHHITMTDFCRMTGRPNSLSTISRPLNDPTYRMNPSLATIDWIYSGMGLPVPDAIKIARQSHPEPQSEAVEVRVAPAAVERVIRLEIRIPPEGEIVVHRLP